MNVFEAEILMPEGSLFSDEVVGVQLPGTAGSFEVKTLHASIISTLETGRVLVRLPAGGEKIFAISGGFVEVHNNKLALLAEAAEPIDEIDVERAQAALDRANDRLASDDPDVNKERALKAKERAQNRLKLAGEFKGKTVQAG